MRLESSQHRSANNNPKIPPKKLVHVLAREGVHKLITKSPFPNGLWVEKRKSLKRREEKVFMSS